MSAARKWQYKKPRKGMENNKDYSVLFVNPVQRVSAQGRHLQNYMILNPMTGEVLPGQPKNKNREDSVGANYGFLINFQSRKLVTGLDEVVPNEFYKLEPYQISIEHSLDYDEWKNILEKVVESEKIKLQTLYEIKAGTSPGYYTNELKNIPLFNSIQSIKGGNDMPYLAGFSVTLYPRPNRFTDETPRSRLAIQVLKNNPRIAKSASEVNPDLHDFYISEENEAQKVRNEKKKLVKKAYYHLATLEQEATSFRRYQIASLCTLADGTPLINGDVSETKVEDALNSYISEDNGDFKRNSEKFIELCELSKTKQGSDKLNIMYLIRQAQNNNIIVARDGYFVWMKMQDKPNVGRFTDYDKMVAFFLKEWKNYIPQDSEVTNWYAELEREVKIRGVRMD